MPSWHCRRIRRAPVAAGERLRHLGLPDAGLALDEQRQPELAGEEDGRRQGAVGEVALLAQRLADRVR